MNQNTINPIVSLKVIESKIYVIRDQKVMLDSDLAELYGVETKYLKRQVRRNIARFPEDFMFELTKDEYDSLRCQNVTLENGRGKHSKYLSFAFSREGIAMLSSVLNSERAIRVNISIMRTFVKIHEYALSFEELSKKIKKLEGKYDKQFQIVFQALQNILENRKKKNEKKIGFIKDDKKGKTSE